MQELESKIIDSEELTEDDIMLKDSDPEQHEVDRIAEITEEIQYHQNESMRSFIDIGTLLNEAKSKTTHGRWSKLLDEVGIHKTKAQRLMRLAGEFPKTSPVMLLGATKAYILLAVPSEEREAFIEATHKVVNGVEKSVADMTKRELEIVVKEYLKNCEQTASQKTDYEEIVEELFGQCWQNNSATAEKMENDSEDENNEAVDPGNTIEQNDVEETDNAENDNNKIYEKVERELKSLSVNLGILTHKGFNYYRNVPTGDINKHFKELKELRILCEKITSVINKY